jgi:hypothetical protein
VLVLVLVALANNIVAGVLGLASQHRLILVRCSSWKGVVPVAEAGLEEALTQIQYSRTATNGWILTNGYDTKTQTNQ